MSTQPLTGLKVLHRGARSDAARALQAATNRRLARRHCADRRLDEDGVVGPKTLAAVVTAAWLLGARRETLEKVEQGEVPIGVQRMIRNPGKRTAGQKALGKRRLAHMLADRKKREKAVADGSARQRIVELALRAAANYRARPGAYHYLCGGKPNTIFLQPTPRDFRSDCSQFVAAVYKAAGVPSPGTVDYKWVSTHTMDPRGTLTTRPLPGDVGMYGRHGGRTSHVELYCGRPGAEFIGHGSPPIDAVIPRRPDYYLTFDFLK